MLLIIGFSITSNSAAMLIKRSKVLRPKFSQLRMCNNLYKRTLSCEEEKRSYVTRQVNLRDAFFDHDSQLVDFLLKDRRVYIDDSMMDRVRSVKFMKVLEKHGLDIKKVSDGLYGGNFLHTIINDPGVDDGLIKYVLEKGVNPHELDYRSNTLWHILVQYASCPNNKLIDRARLLQKLNVNSHSKNRYGKYPIDMVEENIDSLREVYRGDAIIVMQMQELKNLMINKNFAQEKTIKE